MVSPRRREELRTIFASREQLKPPSTFLQRRYQIELFADLPICSLYTFLYRMILSLLAKSPRKYGGLGYSTNDVGTVLAISGMQNILPLDVVL
ncbi:hypothetical protein ARALYDRAFT_909350 [Arabidopsis lyrata subsp. lyrata]|uniref:Uncharacterized protein n=1 Tax=Arabidopsis lyrata subsp. lyrata TaxID=81972 RepID=D7M5Y3_ARALL|nr:hypothetical protein ARALYDRAFT_909350 [Arabidopsis lyrata subsp. lyrata]